MSRWTLAEITRRLARTLGEPKPPPSRDPWRLILWENVAYLANDARRQAAYELLLSSVGHSPRSILHAQDEQLLAVAGHGILAETFAAKLRECASISLELAPDSDGELKSLLEWPLAKAKKALRRFPGIGEPGAEKILLLAGAHAILALESNGLRVLVRLGFAPDTGAYAKTYRLVREALEPQLGDDCDELARLHYLLREHGKSVCKNSAPKCEDCVLRTRCDFAER